MMAFELEFEKLKAKGLSDQEALQKGAATAEAVVSDTLFDYSDFNKPDFMSPKGYSRLPTQFMSFRIQMSSYIFRNFFNMFRSLPKAERKAAATQFFGLTLTTALLSGPVGIFGYSATLGLLTALRDMFRPEMGDDDEDPDYDATDEGGPLAKRSLKTWFETRWIPENFGAGSWVADQLGLNAAQAALLKQGVKMGVVPALTGQNVGSSVSMDNMWIKDDLINDLNLNAAIAQALFEYGLGPTAGLITNFSGAYKDFMNDDPRWKEKASPAFFKGAFTAHRLATQGARTNKGALIGELDKDYFTASKLIGQALGFQDTTLAEAQRRNFQQSVMYRKIEQERMKVIEKLDFALRDIELYGRTDKTQEKFDAAIEDIK
jgi:hypothetical protein